MKSLTGPKDLHQTAHEDGQAEMSLNSSCLFPDCASLKASGVYAKMFNFFVAGI